MKGRIFAVAALLAAVVAGGVPLLYQELLGLGEPQVLLTWYCLGAFGPLATLAAALALWRLKLERKSVLELPARLALMFLAAEALVLTVLTAALNLSGARGPEVLTLVLCTSALFALPAVPLYAYARAALLPLATGLGNESRPTGRRVPIGWQVGYTVIAVSSAALVPAALFAAAQLDRATVAETRARAVAAADRLAQASARLEVAAATKLLTRTPLDGGERLLLILPSGTQLPDDIGPELAGMPYVEKALPGALRGGTLRVFYLARPRPHGPLLLAVLLLLALTIWMAGRAARAVTDDMVGITRQIESVARGETPGPLGNISTEEVRQVALAVNRLLERIPRLTIESFLAIERASDAQRLKSQFLANMSHDLRSPLNSILGFSELLLRGLEGEIQPGQRVTLAVMHATGLRLLRLLNEILDTAKVESGKMELHRQQASPAELIRQAVQEARRGRPPSVTDQLAIELQPGMAPLHVDPLRLTQVATHLVNHAYDSLSPSGGTGVQLRAQETGNPRNFILEIEYPRPGDWDKEHLFDGFRASGPKPGLYLALPLAKRLVEIHGGTLLLSPTPADARVRLRATIPVAVSRRLSS
jgi:signal transduction histidine kinase